MKKLTSNLFVLFGCASQLALFNMVKAADLLKQAENTLSIRVDTPCDFTGLYEEIFDLNLDQFIGANNHVRAARKRILLEHVDAASAAAQNGDLERVLTELFAVMKKVNGGKNDWVVQGPAIDITQELQDLLNCLAEN